MKSGHQWVLIFNKHCMKPEKKKHLIKTTNYGLAWALQIALKLFAIKTFLPEREIFVACQRE